MSPDTAALLGHIVVVAKTVLAGRPFPQPNVAAGVGLLLVGFRLRVAVGDRRSASPGAALTDAGSRATAASSAT